MSSHSYFSGGFGCIVTFKYGSDDLRTLHADSFEQACEQARERWGESWIAEPCVSTPWSVLNDITGRTALKHGHDLGRSVKSAEQERRSLRRRWGRSL